MRFRSRKREIDFVVESDDDGILGVEVKSGSAKAKALMAKKSMKLEEVAAKTGFCDASHLSRILRAYKDAAESGATAR